MKAFNQLTEKQMQHVSGGIAPFLIFLGALGTATVIGGAAGAAAGAASK